MLLATRLSIPLVSNPFSVVISSFFQPFSVLTRIRSEETERQFSQIQDALADAHQQRAVLEGVIYKLKSELHVAREAVERLIPDQQQQQQQQQYEQQQQQQRERDLENKVEMLKIQLAMQEQRSAADSFKIQGAFDATLAYLESRARSSLGKMAERLKVRSSRRQRLP